MLYKLDLDYLPIQNYLQRDVIDVWDIRYIHISIAVTLIVIVVRPI